MTINFVKPYKEPREKVGDKEVFEEVQDGFKIKIETLPKELDVEEYMWYTVTIIINMKNKQKRIDGALK